jgi:hypothetical protein
VLEVLERKPEINLEKQISDSIKALKEKLNATAIEWEVWQFVEGIKIPQDGFEFGKASFYGLESEYVKNRPNDILRQFIFCGEYSRPKANSILCRFLIDAADGKAAIRKADAELNLTLGILNFFVYPRSSRKTGIPAVTEANKMSISRKIDLKEVAVKVAFTESPKLQFQSEISPNSLDFFDIQHYKTSAPEILTVFNQASAFLKGEGEKGFRERILTAMKWAGKGDFAENNEDSFLFFALALESLILGGKNKDELRYRFALRLAHLLGATKSERLNIQNYAKKIVYGIRSTLVHTGQAQIPDSDLDTLGRMTFESIIKLMRDKKFQGIKTDDALESWFEAACLGDN